MIMEKQIEALRIAVQAAMSPRRFSHTLGVEKEMRVLTSYFLPNKEKEGAIAALLHDITKNWPEEKQLAFCQEQGIELSEEEKAFPALLHAKTAAVLLAQQYAHLATPEIISAVQKHTVADEYMTVFDALLYIADFTEEGREYPSCHAVRHFFYESKEDRRNDKMRFLRELLLCTYDASLTALIRLGQGIDLSTVSARNALLNNKEYFS